MNNIDIQISDHAVVRWMERRHGIDLQPLREAIAARKGNDGFARDKMLIRDLSRTTVARMRDEIMQALLTSFDRDGLDRQARMEARVADIGDGWKLTLSPHPGGRSVATVFDPTMEHGNPMEYGKRNSR